MASDIHDALNRKILNLSGISNRNDQDQHQQLEALRNSLNGVIEKLAIAEAKLNGTELPTPDQIKALQLAPFPPIAIGG